jgi:hypothetical protein
MKHRKEKIKKKWNQPKLESIPFKNTLSGGFVDTFAEDATYSLPS